MKGKDIKIVKMTGERAVFDEAKLRRSLERSGASDLVIDQVTKKVETLLYDGISTKEIYKSAFALLRKSSRPTAARYKLKKAIMELGETGYPFEKFVAALLTSEGCLTQVGVIVQGHCVTHEVDVIAQKDNHHYMCECKFHNRQGRHCDVKIPLYIQSRFKDVERAWLKESGHEDKLHQGWIFTNTRFTTDAMQFGKCVGLQLISWDYPKNEGIKDRVDRSGIHPVTCLTTLTLREKKALIELDKILCRDLCNEPELLNRLRVNKPRQKKILNEAEQLCGISLVTQ